MLVLNTLDKISASGYFRLRPVYSQIFPSIYRVLILKKNLRYESKTRNDSSNAFEKLDLKTRLLKFRGAMDFFNIKIYKYIKCPLN